MKIPVTLLILGSFYFNTANTAVPQKIYNGETAENGQFYYMAQIRIGEKLRCGGVLVADKFVLTAGHCIVGFMNKTEQLNIVLNSRYYGGYLGDVYEIDKIQVHPDYVDSYDDINNDIGVITLKGSVKTHEKTNSPRPIKLPIQDIAKDQEVTVIGWGYTHRNRYPFMLQYSKVTLLDKDSCQFYADNQTAFKIELYENEFCTFHKSNNLVGYGTCDGDSGGPLVSDDGYLVGIVTSGIGKNCASGGLDLNMNVYRYLDFINKAIAPKPVEPSETTETGFLSSLKELWIKATISSMNDSNHYIFPILK